MQPKEYATTWTAKGHRLHVVRSTNSLILTVEGQGLNMERGDKFLYAFGRLVVTDNTIYRLSREFIGHSLGYFRDDELTAQGLTALDDTFETLGQPSTN